MSELGGVLHNILKERALTFREYAELALYHPRFGYYTKGENRVGKGGDYVTAPSLSPVFPYALGNLVREFVSRSEAGVCSIVDIGCGDGSLIEGIAYETQRARFFGIDRSLSRIAPRPESRVTYLTSLDEVPESGAHLIFSNELYDAFPFARLVQRAQLRELLVTEREGALDWSEREAPSEFASYFAERDIALEEGQFADVSLQWEAFHASVARFVHRGLIVTIDYGYPAAKLFHPRARRFGTAAAYAGHRVSRDLLADPGEQDLTAHINFTDLERAGAKEGASTVFFDRLAKFLLSQRITDHELFRPIHERTIGGLEEGMELMSAREEARRLVLPDGIGEEMRVLVQAKGIGTEGWSFQQPLFS